jgi:hypothetical protein
MAPESLAEIPPNRRILFVNNTEAIYADYPNIFAGAGEHGTELSDARAASQAV